MRKLGSLSKITSFALPTTLTVLTSNITYSDNLQQCFPVSVVVYKLLIFLRAFSLCSPGQEVLSASSPLPHYRSSNKWPSILVLQWAQGSLYCRPQVSQSSLQGKQRVKPAEVISLKDGSLGKQLSSFNCIFRVSLLAYVVETNFP